MTNKLKIKLLIAAAAVIMSLAVVQFGVDPNMVREFIGIISETEVQK
jgi:hypothetical protein